MNLAIAFSDCAQKHAQKTAIFYGDREISYAELLAQSQKVAAHLQNHFGVKPGDRVALWLKNCPEFVPCGFWDFASGRSRGAHQQFSQTGGSRHILNDGGIDVMITDAELSAHAAN